MNFVNKVGTGTRITASGATVLTSGPVALVGVFVAAVLTGQIVQLFTQTAASIMGTPVVSTCTLAANTWYELPGYFPLGLTYVVTNEDIDLTLFWNPAGKG